MLKNVAKFGFVESLSETFMTMAKFCISLLTTVLSYFLQHLLLKYPDPQPFVLMVAVFLVSYMIASIFISVFEAASNTILMCYLIDYDISLQKNMLEPTHVPEKLRKFMENFLNRGNSVNDTKKEAI
jgi:MFS superfamily sulfate permease-like transporter